MPQQSTLVLSNENGAQFRADLNNALLALAEMQQGSTAPTTTYPFMLWADTSTTPATLRRRKSDNTAWLVEGTLDTPNLGLSTGAQSLATININTNLAAGDFPSIKNITATATINLPAASTISAGKSVTLKSTTTGLVLIAPNGSDTIDGATGNLQIAAYDTVDLMSDGTNNWLVTDCGSANVGDHKPYAGIKVQRGWLAEDGSQVSRTTYAGLFNALTVQITGTVTSGSNSITAVSSTAGIVVGYPVSGPGIPANTTVTAIGTGTLTISQNATASSTGAALVVAPHGVGDGSTTFNLPNSQGRTFIGAGQGSGLTNRVLGAAGGEESHVLATTEISAHGHPLTDNGHSHTYQTGSSYYTTNSGDIANGNTTSTGTVRSSNDGTGITIGNAGGGGGHNNMQPFAVAQFIIKV